MSKLQKPVLMAVIGSAHGTTGEVRVKTFTGDPLALGRYGLLYDQAGRAYGIKSLRLHKTVVVVRFDGVDTRSAAEALNGTQLFVDRSQLPDDLDDDEFYQEDLIGFKVCTADGDEMGHIRAFFNFGGGDLVELALTGGKNQLIPFSKAAVPEIDMAAGRIVVDPLAAGLAAEPDGEAQEA